MLVEVLKKGLFLPPINEIQPFTGLSESTELCHAGKVSPNDRHIDWRTWTADDIFLRQRVLGKLWDDEVYRHCSTNHFSGESKRINYHGWRFPNTGARLGISRLSTGHETRNYILRKDGKIERGQQHGFPAGTPCWVHDSTIEPILGIITCDDRVVHPTSVTIESRPQGEGMVELTRIFTEKKHKLSTR